jgi:predicted O-methyltransferase YrrM
MAVYNDSISRYITDLFAAQDHALEKALEEIRKNGLPEITITPEEGRFLQFLVRASGSTLAVEIGTLGGYSGIWIARGLAVGGRLITLEIEPKHAQVARQNFDRAGVGNRVEIREGDAHQLLEHLTTDSPFDFIFIDAEKIGYPRYLEWAINNTVTGGLIVAHNALRGGWIVDDSALDEANVAMREFNRMVAEDKRLLATIYPGGDGMVVAVRVD